MSMLPSAPRTTFPAVYGPFDDGVLPCPPKPHFVSLPAQHADCCEACAPGLGLEVVMSVGWAKPLDR